jgi:hypothetical protein
MGQPFINFRYSLTLTWPVQIENSYTNITGADQEDRLVLVVLGYMWYHKSRPF